MININFWNFSKRKNSTALPSGTAVSYNCEIKEPSDLTSPQLLLNLGQSEAPAYNYAQIPAFSRYYFITEWRFDRGLWIASLQVDVLASYKTQIGSQSMYVARAASAYDGNIKDMFYPSKLTKTMQNVELVDAVSFTGGYFVVGVLGDNMASGGTTYYQMSADDFAFLIKNLFYTADHEVGWGDVVNGIINSVMNPLQYIASVRWYPYSFPLVSSGGSPRVVQYLKAGLWNVDLTHYFDDQGAQQPRVSTTYQLSGALSSVAIGTYTLPKHPLSADRGNYMNLAPFTRYAIDWGSVYEIDPALIANATSILMRLMPDYTTTDAILKVYAGASATQYPILSVHVPYGMDIPLSQTGIGFSNITQMVGNVGTVAAGAATGNIAEAAAGASSLISGVADSMSPPLSSTRSGSGLGVAYMKKYLKAAFFYPVDDNVAEFGRPLMQTKVINTLSGFIRCQNDDIQIACLDSERDQISSYMTGGFFYE